MTDVTLHPTPRGRDVVAEQIRSVGLGLRPIALGVAAAVAFVTVMIAIDTVCGRAESWFDTGEWAPLMFFAFLLPFAVWWRDKRFAPAFLWSLPVDRRRLALAKVFAGWLWMVLALAAIILWQRALAVLTGVAHPQTISLVSFGGLTAAYLFGSAAVLGLRDPVRWLVGAVGVIFLIGMFNNATRHPHGGDAIDRSVVLQTAFACMDATWRSTPQSWQRLIATTVSILAALAALSAALARHRERRRH
jgi:hypothetical protein